MLGLKQGWNTSAGPSLSHSVGASTASTRSIRAAAAAVAAADPRKRRKRKRKPATEATTPLPQLHRLVSSHLVSPRCNLVPRHLAETREKVRALLSLSISLSWAAARTSHSRPDASSRISTRFNPAPFDSAAPRVSHRRVVVSIRAPTYT